MKKGVEFIWVGIWGRILFIDLSRQEFWTQETQEEMKKMYIGGKGFGIKLLYDLTPPGIEPFDERMPIIFVSGPLTGTFAPSMRGCVVSKSPLNNMFDDFLISEGILFRK